jgi:hypothetical protein
MMTKNLYRAAVPGPPAAERMRPVLTGLGGDLETGR